MNLNSLPFLEKGNVGSRFIIERTVRSSHFRKSAACLSVRVWLMGASGASGSRTYCSFGWRVIGAAYRGLHLGNAFADGAIEISVV